jgi:hypothetical protein
MPSPLTGPIGIGVAIGIGIERKQEQSPARETDFDFDLDTACHSFIRVHRRSSAVSTQPEEWPFHTLR